jgi:hypothetical protein
MCAALTLGASAAQEPKTQRPAPQTQRAPQSTAESVPDEELLEFLGSFDEEDGDWVDYLTTTDVAPRAPSRPAPPAPQDKKHD